METKKRRLNHVYDYEGVIRRFLKEAMVEQNRYPTTDPVADADIAIALRTTKDSDFTALMVNMAKKCFIERWNTLIPFNPLEQASIKVDGVADDDCNMLISIRDVPLLHCYRKGDVQKGFENAIFHTATFAHDKSQNVLVTIISLFTSFMQDGIPINSFFTQAVITAASGKRSFNDRAKTVTALDEVSELQVEGVKALLTVAVDSKGRFLKFIYVIYRELFDGRRTFYPTAIGCSAGMDGSKCAFYWFGGEVDNPTAKIYKMTDRKSFDSVFAKIHFLPSPLKDNDHYSSILKLCYDSGVLALGESLN